MPRGEHSRHIVMPETTPLVKIENTRAHGRTVVLFGETLYEAQHEVERRIGRDNAVLLHPYDDARVMAGQGTIALEMLADFPALDCIVVPLGGGGIGAGNAIAAKALKPSIEMIGVEAQLYPSFHNAVRGSNLPSARRDAGGRHRGQDRGHAHACRLSAICFRIFFW